MPTVSRLPVLGIDDQPRSVRQLAALPRRKLQWATVLRESV
jgi:hypothetical protein